MRRFVLKVEPAVYAADISPDGSQVATLAYPRSPLVSGVPVEVSELLRLWDVPREHLIASVTLASWQGHPPHYPDVRLFVRFTADGKRLVAYDGGSLQVLRVPDLMRMAKVDLGLPAQEPYRGASAVDMQVSPGGQRAALLLWRDYVGRSAESDAGGWLRVYDLRSGRLQREWSWSRGMPGRVAWAPDSRRLALTWLPVIPGRKLPKRAKNLLILDADSGGVLGEINAGYVAGPVAFAGSSLLLTASMNSNTDYFRRDTIRVWDASTGRLVREIANPPEGIHFQMAASADGRVVLGYVGLEKYNEQAHGNDTIYRKFRLWEVASGKVLATSPKLGAVPMEGGEWNTPDPDDAWSSLRLALSADGTHVLLYWESAGVLPVLVYQAR